MQLKEKEKVKEMKEVNEAEVDVEVMAKDRLDVATVDEVQISSITVTRKEKAQQENVEEVIQA